MSDSIKKWEEMNEGREYKPFFKRIVNRLVSQEHKQQAYQILVEYPKEAILEAARIIEVGE